MTARTSDVAILGAGLIGRSAALACARRGRTVTLFDTREPGESSPAGAGMLAPAMEGDGSPSEKLLIAGRDLWPSYVAELAALSPVSVHLSRDGILALAHDPDEAGRQRHPAPGRPRWRSSAELSALEPGLRAPDGGVLHELDGAVDNVALIAALDFALAAEPRVGRVGAAVGVERDGQHVRVLGRDGSMHLVRFAVVAAGAWAPKLTGLPRPLPVEPVRGEMLGFPVAATRHCIYGNGAYVVARPGGRTIVGATMERVGFDPSTTARARQDLHAAVAAFLPQLANVEPDAHWAGLRPVSPDGLPILGPDPRWPAIIHATGHSRNGILLTPMTAAAVASWASDERPAFDFSPFRPDRFE